MAAAVRFDDAPGVETFSEEAGATATDETEPEAVFKSEIPRAKSYGGEEDEDAVIGEEALLRKAFVLLLTVVVIPLWCRLFYLAPSTRCGLVITSMLLINLFKVMPLFCTALFVPVLGTLCAVLGDTRTVKDTSTLLIGTVFNNTSFMVLGALVINGIFTKCGLDQRFMQALLRTFSLEGPIFLLVLVLGGALMCSVLYSGSLVLLAALNGVLEQRIRTRTLPPNAAKRILLAAAFAANAGSTVLPISSPVTLITVSLLNDFGYEIPINTWVAICLPVVVVAMVCSWLVLLVCFPVDKVDATVQEASRQTCEHQAPVALTDWHMIFMGVGTAAVLGITIYATKLEPIIGHSACLSLAVVVIVFGSGFMSRDEFCGLDWDILALVGGTNVVAFLVRETGLGVELAEAVVKAGLVESVPYHGLLAIMVFVTMGCSTLMQHSITGVLLMPLVVAVGIKLQAPETTAILVATAVPFGMGLNYSSFDNQLSHRTSFTLGRKEAQLTDANWRNAGGCTSIFGGLTILTLGYFTSLQFYKLPPPVWVVENMTPENLVPKVAKENLRVGGQHFGMSLLQGPPLSRPAALRPFGLAAKLTAARPRRVLRRARGAGKLDAAGGA